MSFFKTVVVDPPWTIKAGPYSGPEGFVACRNRPSRDMAYQTMSDKQIAELPVGRIAAPDSHLYLWTINAWLEACFAIARAWGFQPSTVLVWAKNPMGGGMGGCYGISTEFILFCRRGRAPAASRIGSTWFNWKRPYDERGKPRHSSKPHEFYEMVENVSPGPRAELFARNQRPGWSVWGNEVESCSLITETFQL